MADPAAQKPSGDVSTRRLEATARVLAEQKPWAIKVRTVARVAGLSTTVVSSHFGGVSTNCMRSAIRRSKPGQMACQSTGWLGTFWAHSLSIVVNPGESQ